MARPSHLRLRGASEHNLRELDVDLPRGKLIAISGVSGSGKSSLAFDTIFREGQRLFLSSLSTYARQFLRVVRRPDLAHASGLSPAIAVDQHSVPTAPRSTVGTVSGCLDVLRLLFARRGVRAAEGDGADIALSRSLFSFNSPQGACESCKGLGVEDRVDPELLVADATRSLRQGALVPTTPNGYIVYSQVTVEVLERIAKAHGFDLDTPWQELEPAQREVVLGGSKKLKVPFGKHPLESRMRWSGITARPREEGYYRGLVPVIEEILARDRNENALRFARSRPCSACGGARLRPEALAVTVAGRSIAELCALSVAELQGWLDAAPLDDPLFLALKVALETRLALLVDLGLAHPSLGRPVSTLSGGERRRLRLCTQLLGELSGVLYVLDEPTAGLHAEEGSRLLDTLERLRDRDNTVIIVEHDTEALRRADYLVDVGPGAGAAGGRLLASGPPSQLLADRALCELSPTLQRWQAERGASKRLRQASPSATAGEFGVRGAHLHVLSEVDVTFRRGALNVLCGRSGAGKTTLLRDVLGQTLRRRLDGKAGALEGCCELWGAESFARLVEIDDSPLGRTPRSNAATYTKLFDPIRKHFAAEQGARERGLTASSFSFNTKGGRCDACEGAGVRSVGMHFMANVEVPCEACEGRRFTDDVLQVRALGLNITEVLALSVEQARERLAAIAALQPMLEALSQVGLGYLSLGQPSTTLSGGEAQRVKLAAELGRPRKGHALYLLDEPTIGLHPADVERLLGVLSALVASGHTVVIVDHDLDLLGGAAELLIELDAGRVVGQGTPAQLAQQRTPTGRALARWAENGVVPSPAKDTRGESEPAPVQQQDAITLRGVRTHTLTGFDVSFPLGKLSVVTGLSGSGKSSLVFDTLAAESQRRFTETLSAHTRRFLGRLSRAELDGAEGLRPAIAVGQAPPARNPRSTVATMTEIYDVLRLLYARLGTGAADQQLPLSARLFSFNHESGACKSCRGLGEVQRVDAERLVSDETRSLLDGALDAHPRGRFYGERDGQYVATLRAVGANLGIDYALPYEALDDEARDIALHGAGDRQFSVLWSYQRGKRVGEHRFEGPWLGFATLLEQEYTRTHGDQRGERIEALLEARACPSCEGRRLAPEVLAVQFAGRSISELTELTVAQAEAVFRELSLPAAEAAISAEARSEILRRLRALRRVGLSYLPLDRSAMSLSAGEARRVRLAAQLSGGLCDVLYVLDEPTIGLHRQDTAELLGALGELCEEGNTVVLVEHDEAVLRAADHIIELGPGAGRAGGQLVAAGSPAELAKQQTLTARLLQDSASAATNGAAGAPFRVGEAIEIRGAQLRNLQRIDVELPKRALVAISGVSGSGKSTLLFDVLAKSVERGQACGARSVAGTFDIANVQRIDARPIGRTPASMPATLLDLLDPLRKLFADSDAAKEAGLSRAAFSPNSKLGQCSTCKGLGALSYSLDFLADVWVVCDECRGRRFNPRVQALRWRGLSIADVLELTAGEARTHFDDIPRLRAPLALLDEVGLGYLTLGQWSTTLSGGEAQRLKLARELSRPRGKDAGATLYLFDEPTAGLHPRDVDRLVDVLRKLVDRGDSVIVVEHDLGLLARCDWIIDLGPGGGPDGGRVVAAGTPVQLAQQRDSATGRALAGMLR